MKSGLIFLIIISAFSMAFSRHVSFLMYPLSGYIFYRYVPVIYTTCRINILHHPHCKQLFGISFYPLELIVWLICALFFSFVIDHLLADIFFLHLQSLYHFTWFLIAITLIGIVYIEPGLIKQVSIPKTKAFEIQGRLLSFEVLFVTFLLFSTNH